MISHQSLFSQGIAKAGAIVKQGSIKLRWLPLYVRFQSRGHGSAWRIFTHMTPEERLLLYRLGLQQQPGAVLLEVGSYLGASASFLAAAISEIGGGGNVHCVDTWQNQAMTEGLRDTWAEFQTNTRPYASLIVPHRGCSVDVSKTFEEEIDMLFLDGDHSYEGCRADVESWLPHLKPGGILVIHDYGWAEGVRRTIRELIQPRQREQGHVLQNTYWTRF
jgi:predicted O-methyltransferase YrrM